MSKREMKLSEGVRRILLEHYKGSKSVRDSTDRLYQVMDLVGGDTPLRNIDERTISKLKLKLKETGNSNATVNRKLSALSKLLTTAHEEWLVISRKPAIKKLKETKSEVHLLSVAEEVQILNFLRKENPLTASMVVCLLYTGCRLSEMIRLQENDVNWTDRRLKVRDTKNGDPIRVIPMTQKVEKELNELMLVQGNTAPFSAH